jgi:hypothetical protein
MKLTASFLAVAILLAASPYVMGEQPAATAQLPAAFQALGVS